MDDTLSGSNSTSAAITLPTTRIFFAWLGDAQFETGLVSCKSFVWHASCGV